MSISLINTSILLNNTSNLLNTTINTVNNKQNTINLGITPFALINNTSGNVITSTTPSSKLIFLNNVSSDIQTQINSLTTTVSNNSGAEYFLADKLTTVTLPIIINISQLKKTRFTNDSSLTNTLDYYIIMNITLQSQTSYTRYYMYKIYIKFINNSVTSLYYTCYTTTYSNVMVNKIEALIGTVVGNYTQYVSPFADTGYELRVSATTITLARNNTGGQTGNDRSIIISQTM